jgi:hypothetical protein
VTTAKSQSDEHPATIKDKEKRPHTPKDPNANQEIGRTHAQDNFTIL